MATNRWRVKDFGVWWKNHVNTDAILLFGKGLYNIDSCMWKYDMWAGLCIYGTLFPTVLQDSQSICELHGISFLDLLLVYEYYIYTACMYNICLPRESKVQTLAMVSRDSFTWIIQSRPFFVWSWTSWVYIFLYTDAYQHLPKGAVLKPLGKMVNWHPEREPFGTQTGRSRYLYYIIYIKCISMDVKS